MKDTIITLITLNQPTKIQIKAAELLNSFRQLRDVAQNAAQNNLFATIQFTVDQKFQELNAEYEKLKYAADLADESIDFRTENDEDIELFQIQIQSVIDRMLDFPNTVDCRKAILTEFLDKVQDLYPEVHELMDLYFLNDSSVEKTDLETIFQLISQIENILQSKLKSDFRVSKF